MELIFNKIGKWYEAEFEITDNINLHVELNVAAPIKLYQKTSGNKYDLVQAFKPSTDEVLDIDLTALVYPKQIKVVSASEVTMAAVNPDGAVVPVYNTAKYVLVADGSIKEPQEESYWNTREDYSELYNGLRELINSKGVNNVVSQEILERYYDITVCGDKVVSVYGTANPNTIYLITDAPVRWNGKNSEVSLFANSFEYLRGV